MSLSKKRNRDRMRVARATQVQPEIVQPVTPKQEKLAELRQIIANPIALKSSPVKEESKLPWYNPRIHKAGDRVRMRGPTGKLVEVTVPELDGEGNTIPEF